jgi:hypothetical protein
MNPIVFIVPYRNRPEHKYFFSKYMSTLLGDKNYEIYFIHQNDTRSFNRGGMKNIGFLSIKEKYPNYKDINFVFNDVDTIPFNDIFTYQTTEGVVKHYYGFEHALGGIVVIKGSDFEKINGFPNCWGWGSEDTSLQKRCIMHNLTIDRSDFKCIGNPQILQLFDGVERIINRSDYINVKYDISGKEGLNTLYHPIFSIDTKSKNEKDNVHIVDNEKIFIVNVDHFTCGIQYNTANVYRYDIRDSKRKIINPSARKQTNQAITSTDDWKNIRYRKIR